MIPAETQRYGNELKGYKYVEPGPALRMDLGDGALKEVAGPYRGWFQS